MIQIYILIVLVIVLVVIYCVTQRKFIKLSWQLPGPPLVPFFGNALHFICKDEDIFEKCVELISQYPSPMRGWFGPKMVVIFSKIEHINKIMSSMKFTQKDNVYRFIQQFDGESLISGSGIKWKNDRRLMTHMFLKRNIEQYFPQILNHVKIMLEKLEPESLNGSTFNIEHYVHRCATDFVDETIIGIKTDAQNGEMDEFIKQESRMYVIVHARILKVWLQYDWMFRLSHYWKEHEEGKKIIHGFMRKALYSARERRKTGQNVEGPPSFLDLMLDILKEHPNWATDEEIDHHLTTMYSASEDTVTTICCFTFVLLGMYPNIQNRLVEEIKNVVGKKYVELDDLPKLNYLDMCVKDVLRLFPIAPFIMRIPSEDVKIGNYLIPKGCSTVVSIQSLHRDPDLWEKPNDFYPEHFLPDAVSKRPVYSYMPFSAGPRGCLGRPYADMAMKIIIVSTLQRYEFESDGCLQEKRLRTDISVRFWDDQYPVRIKKRVQNVHTMSENN